MFDEAEFRKAVAESGETMSKAADVMGMNRATLYKKMSGSFDFCASEMEAFCCHYKADLIKVFFAQPKERKEKAQMIPESRKMEILSEWLYEMEASWREDAEEFTTWRAELNEEERKFLYEWEIREKTNEEYEAIVKWREEK